MTNEFFNLLNKIKLICTPEDFNYKEALNYFNNNKNNLTEIEQDSIVNLLNEKSNNDSIGMSGALGFPDVKEINKKYKYLICLDNGHAESTPGKRSPDGKFREYLWTRECVNKIIELSKADSKYKDFYFYIVTPESVTDIGLTERANRANRIMNSLKLSKSIFISIHVNAAGNGSNWLNTTGWSAYTTKNFTNSDILADYLYNAAETILYKKYNKKIRKYSNKEFEKDFEENFTVILKADMPAVLTENFFQDNIEDVKWLDSKEGLEACAYLHLEGIYDYCTQNN